MKLIATILFLLCGAAGIALMAHGYRLNREQGTKQYHPGTRFVSWGMILAVVCGLALIVLASEKGGS